MRKSRTKKKHFILLIDEAIANTAKYSLYYTSIGAGIANLKDS